MKKIKFFAVALAVLTMLSCSKETNQMNEVPSGAEANVTISLQGTETRANINTTPYTDDQKINNYIAFFFTEGGALVSKHYVADPTAADANKLETTISAKKVSVVANTGALAGGLFETVATEAQLKAVSGSLSTQTTSPFTASTQTGTNVWSAGSGAVTFTGDEGTATVAMSFLAAKIEVIVKDERTNNGDPSKIQITNTDIVLLNAGGQAKFFATESDKMIQTSWFNGDTSYADPTNTVEAAFLSETYTETGVYFYAFGNSSEGQPTILAIKANRVEKDGAATVVYYPIAFSSADAGATITEYADFVPGQHYTVTLTLKGDVAGGGGGGTVNPEEPLVTADVTVTIIPAAWIPKAVGKEFN